MLTEMAVGAPESHILRIKDRERTSPSIPSKSLGASHHLSHPPPWPEEWDAQGETDLGGTLALEPGALSAPLKPQIQERRD